MTDTPQSLAQQTSAGQTSEPATPDILSWHVMEARVRKQINDWETEVLETKRRRAIRRLDINTEALRSENKLQPDEVLIGVRVIDENIRKEQPMYVEYLTQSRRLAVFDCQTNPQLNTEPLEIAFTKGMSYSGFLRNIFKTIDGGQTHAWDSVEILFDSSKPLHCGVEHIGHENLIFARDSKDIQAQEYILRAFDVTIVQLRRFRDKYKFSSSVIQDIITDQEQRQADAPKNVRIYKYFAKHQGIVYVAWCALRQDGEGSSVSGWLKEPAPLDLGRRQLQERIEFEEQVIDESFFDEKGIPGIRTSKIKVPKKTKEWVPEIEEYYPIVPFIYSESEEQCITAQKGRVFFDLPYQEAQTALRSLVINGAVRASNIYAAPSQPSSTGSALRKLDFTLDPGTIVSEPMNFFHPDYPDPALLRAADSLDVRKAQELGQSASAVINRDDSRKTAQELKQARQEQMQMGTIPIMQFSHFMREVLSLCWYIVQSQAVQNLIKLLPVEIQIPSAPPNPTLPSPPPRTITINNPEYLAQTYDIKPAGDIDVIRRAEKLERRFTLLPIIQPTPVYPEFLMDLIKELLPEDAEKYNNILRQGMETQQQQMLAMAQMLQEATTDDTGNIRPEFTPFASQLQQLFSQLPKNESQSS